MKYLISLLLLIAVLAVPHITNAAVAHDSSGSCLEGTGATSKSCSFTNTAGNLMVVVISNRLTVGGCSTTDIDALSVTYNGAALSFLKGDTTDGVAGGSGTCVFGHVLYLTSPSTGANTLAMSWTGTARVAASIKTFSGANGGTGTIGETNSTGNFSLNSTITASDMLMGGLVVADNTSNYAMLDSNALETADAGGNTGSGANTNTGSGSVNVHGTYGAFRRVFWAIPILASAGGGGAAPTVPEEPIFFQ